jgi:hypothetical protein
MAAKKELMNVASDEQLAALAQELPQEPSFKRVMLPRFGLQSQTKTEEVGTGKNMKLNILARAGTFFTERETDEVTVREDGSESKVWEKTDFEDEVIPEGIIFFKRYQLRYYDEAEEKYTSSPVFDSMDEQVVLFKDRKEVARGSVSELKALYPGVSKKGKPISKLNEEKILYVLIDDEVFQLNLHGSSMWAYDKYAARMPVAQVVTQFGSTAEEKGDIKWNKMSFTAKRKITGEEATRVLGLIAEIKSAISGEKEYFAGIENADSALDKQMDALTADATPAVAKLGKAF